MGRPHCHIDGDVIAYQNDYIDTPTQVYNFTAGNTHNYFAGGIGAWVHNADNCKLTPKQVGERKKAMDDWENPAHKGSNFKEHELSGALDYEMITGKELKPTTKKSPDGKPVGDFEDVNTGEIIDHMGVGPGLKNSPNTRKVMNDFKKSIDKHIGKLKLGVDKVLLDLKGFNKAQLAEIKDYMKKFSKEELGKVFTINKSG